MVGLSVLTRCHKSIWLTVVKTQEQKSVIEVDTKTFDKVVTSSNRNCFILFYSPDCQHCQKFKPTWITLGEMLRHEYVNIVQIDALNNQWPEKVYPVGGYPTMYWRYADGRQPTQYNGDRNINSLMKFVAKQMDLKEFDSDGKRIPRKG